MSVDVTRLPSGLVVVTEAMPHLETASLGVWVGAGSRDERPNEHGISHLLEHMAFKGTSRRSARQIAEEIEAVGGDLNAATSIETTAYYARVLRADVPLALDVLSDILANPSFVPDELEREKSVIVQEIGAAQDTPDDVVFEHLNELCFPDQPMGRSLLGTAKTLKNFDRDMLRGYLSTHYRGPDMVVAAPGAVDCWGSNAQGQAGLGAAAGSNVPMLVNGTLYLQIVGGENHTCGLREGGAVFCLGDNAFGQLGDGSTVDRKVPTAVSGGIAFVSSPASYLAWPRASAYIATRRAVTGLAETLARRTRSWSRKPPGSRASRRSTRACGFPGFPSPTRRTEQVHTPNRTFQRFAVSG